MENFESSSWPPAIEQPEGVSALQEAAFGKANQSILGAAVDRLSSQLVSDLETKIEVNQYVTGGIKTAALFLRGKAGLAATVGTSALDAIGVNDSTFDQTTDGSLGVLKGLAIRGVFAGSERMHLDFAGQAAILGIGSRLSDNIFDKTNYLDARSQINFQNGIGQAFSNSFDVRALAIDFTTFGLAHGLTLGASKLTGGAIVKSRLFSNALTGAAFGFSTGANTELTRQTAAGQFDSNEIARKALLQSAVDGVAALPGGLQSTTARSHARDKAPAPRDKSEAHIAETPKPTQQPERVEEFKSVHAVDHLCMMDINPELHSYGYVVGDSETLWIKPMTVKAAFVTPDSQPSYWRVRNSISGDQIRLSDESFRSMFEPISGKPNRYSSKPMLTTAGKVLGPVDFWEDTWDEEHQCYGPATLDPVFPTEWVLKTRGESQIFNQEIFDRWFEPASDKTTPAWLREASPENKERFIRRFLSQASHELVLVGPKTEPSKREEASSKAAFYSHLALHYCRADSGWAEPPGRMFKNEISDLARINATHGNYDEAIKLFNLVVHPAPNEFGNVWSANELADTYEKAGRIDEAAKLHEEKCSYLLEHGSGRIRTWHLNAYKNFVNRTGYGN